MTDIALRYLHEAAQAGTMRAAGERMGIAVSSISRQIAQLELDYGTPMIERGRREIRLTEAGQLAVEHYRTQRAEREVFLAQLASLRGVRSGSVTLAVGEGFLGQAFTDLLHDFQQQFPQVRVTVETGSTVEIVRRLLADEAHLGLVFQVPGESKIRLRASAVQPLMVLVAPSHPLAQQRSTNLAELTQHALCLSPKYFRIRQILAVAEAKQHLFLDPAMTTNSLLVMRDAARSGRFATVLPSIAALAELRDGSVVGVPLVDEELENTMIGLVSRVGRQLEGAPLKMLGMLERRLRSWTGAENTPG